MPTPINPQDIAFSSSQAFFNAGGAKDFSGIQTVNQGQAATGQFYKYADNSTVFQNSLFGKQPPNPPNPTGLSVVSAPSNQGSLGVASSPQQQGPTLPSQSKGGLSVQQADPNSFGGGVNPQSSVTQGGTPTGTTGMSGVSKLPAAGHINLFGNNALLANNFQPASGLGGTGNPQQTQGGPAAGVYQNTGKPLSVGSFYKYANNSTVFNSATNKPYTNTTDFFNDGGAHDFSNVAIRPGSAPDQTQSGQSGQSTNPNQPQTNDATQPQNVDTSTPQGQTQDGTVNGSAQDVQPSNVPGASTTSNTNGSYQGYVSAGGQVYGVDSSGNLTAVTQDQLGNNQVQSVGQQALNDQLQRQSSGSQGGTGGNQTGYDPYSLYKNELASRGIGTGTDADPLKQLEDINLSIASDQKVLAPLQIAHYQFPSSMQELQDGGITQDQLDLKAAQAAAPIQTALSFLIQSRSAVSTYIDQQTQLAKTAVDFAQQSFQNQLAAAPQNVATEYNELTGAVSGVVRDPRTGQQAIVPLGNIGAQKAYTSQGTYQNILNGHTMFYGITPDGQVESHDLTTGTPASSTTGVPGFSNGSGVSGFVPGTGNQYRTDRNSNPTAMTTAVAASLGLTAGVDYTQGDSFKGTDGQTYYTAKLNGDPIQTTIKALDTAAQSPTTQAFYTASGKQRWSYMGMTDQQWLGMSPDQKTQTIAQMYQREGGSGSLLGKNNSVKTVSTQSQTEEQNLPAFLAGGNTLKHYSDGTPFIDSTNLSPEQITIAKNLAPNIPILTGADVNKVRDIDVTQQNLNALQTFVNKNFSGGFGPLSKLYNIGQSTIGQLTGGTFQTQLNEYRTAAINAIQGLAGGEGSNIRITAGEIQIATDNLPTSSDTQGQALTKLGILQGFLDKWRTTILPNSGNSTSNVLDNIIKQNGG